MHWEPTHVNPLLALRTSACNDRWDESTALARTHLQHQRLEHRRTRQQQRSDRLLRPLLVGILLLTIRATPSAPVAVPSPKCSGPSRPSATHPWRKPLVTQSRDTCKTRT
ncbi:MAG TPA: hypothetical protein VH164_00735 [Ktedonobacteraceae bacterium]|nr:hypothetical protein [Ktedonobacteraceae bacterium]